LIDASHCSGELAKIEANRQPSGCS